MKPGVTTEFETTEFAGITAKIINPYPSPFTVLDMTSSLVSARRLISRQPKTSSLL